MTTDADEYKAELMAVLLMSAATAGAEPMKPGASGRSAERARRLATPLG
ncbi:hypothetical protein [Amycolatopsis sp. FDAARGOS 1241]|nr:hypothetical protein [Amycolatopsis sp. FDAARGOS 1241]